MKVDYSQAINLPNQFDEVFVLAEDKAEAQFVTRRLNSSDALTVRRQREKHVLANGVVNEVLMPDTLAGIYAALYDRNEQRKQEEEEKRSVSSALWVPPGMGWDREDWRTNTEVLSPANVSIDTGDLEIFLRGQSLTLELNVGCKPKVTMTVLDNK